ncbi:MAG: hypothetical protein HQL02_10275 [Nitrospirae bacterium]|nr:hypothetical protein [Nitrospirota bacterium]
MGFLGFFKQPGEYIKSGMARVKKGDYDRAIADCTKACDIDPDNPDHETLTLWKNFIRLQIEQLMGGKEAIAELRAKEAAIYGLKKVYGEKFDSDLLK